MTPADDTGRRARPTGEAGRRPARPGHPLLSNIGRVVIALIAVGCLLVSAVGWTVIGKLGRDVTSAGGLDIGGDTLDGAVDILLVGTDNRTDARGNPLSQAELETLRTGEEDSENTDTIILVRIPQDGRSATAISIPRDTYIQTSALGKTKINGVYGATKEQALAKSSARHADGKPTDADQHEAVKQGRNALIAAVRGLTGVEVDHYAEIGLLGFVLLTDAVGGVPVCLKEAVDEPLSGANFHAGEQTVSGADALSFVRQRHDLPAGDLDRIVRQQVFMAQLVKKILSAGTLTDPSKLNRLTQAAQRSFVIDENWDFVDFAMKLKDMSGGAVAFETIPVTGIDGVGENGESVVTVDTKKVQAFVRALAQATPAPSSAAPTTAGKPPAPDPATITVEVVNTTERSGLAGSVSETLAELGYQAGDVSSSPGGAYTSHVSAPTAGDAAAFAVAEKLGRLPVQVDPAIPDNTVKVVLAEDYTGPSSEITPSTVTDAYGYEQTVEAEPLPPSIAKRPTFDAGGTVPCVD